VASLGPPGRLLPLAVRPTILPHWEETDSKVLWKDKPAVSIFKAEQGIRMSPKYWAQEMEAEVASANK